MRGISSAVRRVAMTMLVVLAGGAGATGCARGQAVTGPVAAVADAKGTIALVDLEQGKVVRTVRMRSWVGDIEADRGLGTFVTAQSGGVGDDADDRVGVIDVRTTGAVTYVRLPRPNPGGVEVVGRGRVAVDHGWDEKGGMFACLVDTATGKVVRSGHIPDNNIPMKVIGGVGWASCAGIDGKKSLRRVDMETLASSEVLVAPDFPVIETSTDDGLAGWLVSEPGEGRVALFDGKTGAVVASAAVDLDDGPGPMVSCRDRLVAVDFAGVDMEHPGCRLVVLDPKTLELEREIRMPGGPSDIAVWRDRVVVVNYLDQTLQLVDPLSGRTEPAIELPEMTKLQLRVAVLD